MEQRTENRIGIAASLLVFAAMAAVAAIAIGFRNETRVALRNLAEAQAANGPALSGVTLEWTVKIPDREPVKVIHQLEVGETTAQWQQKLRELIDGVENFDE